jgi:hypothetical protein
VAYRADIVARHHPEATGDGAAKRRLAARNRALTAWMCLPVRTAAAETVTLFRTAASDLGHRTLASFAIRLPRALIRRRRPDPAVEAALTRLAAAAVESTVIARAR